MPKPFYLLAIETSGRTGSVALAEGVDLADGDQQVCRIVANLPLPANERAARSLLPAIQALLAEAQLAPSDLGGVAVAVGPGSFTGLRVGVTAAKTFAFAASLPLAAVCTLDLFASQAREAANQSAAIPDKHLWAIIDAGRGELYAGCYDCTTCDSTVGDSTVGIDLAVDPTQILSDSDWLGQLQPGDRVVGPALAKYAEQLGSEIHQATTELCQATATTVAKLGLQKILAGQTCDPFQLVPQYHRPSAAEEKAAK